MRTYVYHGVTYYNRLEWITAIGQYLKETGRIR